ncbi:ACT domain-containing protein [Candidatus Pacearchaeota archaeon]|nr:ACT domain-containing protein [Candidatus Pacearchaeota archaeon]
MIKIAVLGPEYSYCHILGLKKFANETIVLCKTIPEVYEKVSKDEVEFGLAPIENMLHGTVRESLVSLQKYKVKINKTFDLPIHLCLASKTDNFNIIISKQEALSQCLKLISRLKKQTQECSSTSEAMKIASSDSNYAALGSEEAAKSLNLKIIGKDVEDNSDNITRFVLISKKESDLDESKYMRTSLMILPERDKPGLLYEILSIFKIRYINLTKIESIPTRKKLGEYEFFMEIEGSLQEERIISALNLLKTIHDIYLFGSYELEKIM